MSGAAEGLITRQNVYLAAPSAGGIVCVTMSTAATAIDLTSMAGWPGNQVSTGEQGPLGKNTSPIEHFLSVEADGTDAYVAFCTTLAQATAISQSATTAVNGQGQLAATNTATGTIKVPVNTVQRFRIPAGQLPASGQPYGGNSPCRYLAVITATTSGQLRFWQSSP